MAAIGKTCGECSVCCTVLEVTALGKAARTRCVHIREGSGCGIYETRPQACRQFECGYLQNPELGPEWRPDRAGFMMYFSQPGPRLNVIDADGSGTWRREPFIGQLRQWSRRDLGYPIEVAVHTGDELLILFPDDEIALGPNRPLPTRSGYRLENGKPTAFAEFVEPGERSEEPSSAGEAM